MPYQGGKYGMALLSAWPIVATENIRLVGDFNSEPGGTVMEIDFILLRPRERFEVTELTFR